jgi:hypothetical protein
MAGRRGLVLGALSCLAAARPSAATLPIDARHAVLCSWVFDRGVTPDLPPPFGFVVERSFNDADAGYLGVLLRTRTGPAAWEWMLVNRGTRFEAASVLGFLRGLAQDMSANAGIQFGRRDIAMVDAALAAGEAARGLVRDAAGTGGPLPLLLLGQSMGGALAQLQAVAAWDRAATRGEPWQRIGFVTFAASDAARVMARRFPGRLAALPPEIGVNHVARRDGMTGPDSVFGQARLGVQNVVDGMQGPSIVSLGLDFHRTEAWVNHCAGQQVNAAVPPMPDSAAAWRAVAVGCALPPGWPVPGPP